MTEKKYRVGIIGCGGISRAHANAYKAQEKVELIAAADIKKEALEKFAEEFSVAGKYEDYREMLDREALDIVSVCTWPGLHAEMTISAAEAQAKAVLCEKPMCLSLGEADAMIEACEKSGTKLAIGHQHRFDPPWPLARRLIKERSIGQPTAIIRRRLGGLLNNGTHVIDGMRYILGDPETKWVIGQIERKTDRQSHGRSIEDISLGLICFDCGAEGGTRGIIETDIPPEHFYRVCGTEGMMVVERAGGSVRLLNEKEAEWQEFKPTGPNSYVAEVTELVSWIEGKTRHRGEANQARYTMEIMMAIYESVRIKGMVRMPLEAKESPLKLMLDDGTL